MAEEETKDEEKTEAEEEHTEAEESAEAEKPEDEQSEWYKQGIVKEQPSFIARHKKATVGVILLALLGFGGNYYISKSTEKAPLVTSSILDTLALEEGAVNEDGPVATVNGVEVPRLAYSNKLYEINASLSRQGFNTGNAKIASQIRQQAVSELVNTEILYQSAVANGITVTKEEIGDAYQDILEDAGSEEVLLLMLQDRSLTTENLYENIERTLIVDKYLDQEIDFASATVSAEEVRAYYDMVSATDPDLPSFDGVEKNLTAELKQQKAQQLVTNFVQSLRTEAEIEILI